jgi:TPR repeat protein
MAQNDLGLLCGNGYGLVKDHVKAHMWFNIASSSGLPEGGKN